MIFQTGAALLDAIVLAVVSKEEEGTYGYKITQEVRSTIEVSESTLYPVLRRLQKNLPPHGCVRLLQVTEKQYGRMRLLVGDMPVMEKEAATQLLLF